LRSLPPQLSGANSLVRARRLKRRLRDYSSDVVLSGVLFVLLVWMGFVALTLWH
jgi:hypothetical protein